jgi:hypothetical protein|tara:strand:+ start:542 stop:868 length:327 start_codon:yes stop_codon:yes gene_type:complete
MQEHIVLMLKLLLFICIILGYVSYRVYVNYKSDNKTFFFPPWPSKCPDLWEVHHSGGCYNIKGLGHCNKNDIAMFDEPIFNGKDSLYFKCKWAHNCNVSWEGIDKLCI